MVIKITPTTFSYYCELLTVYPSIVREKIIEDFASGYSKTSLQLSLKDTKQGIERLKKYLAEEF